MEGREGKRVEGKRVEEGGKKAISRKEREGGKGRGEKVK